MQIRRRHWVRGWSPDASYCEALRRLAWLLAQVLFGREWHLPCSKVITCWPAPVPPSVMEERFWRAAGPLITDDARSAVLLAGMPVCGIDGSLIAVADTKANRKVFGCADTKSQHDAGAAPHRDYVVRGLTNFGEQPVPSSRLAEVPGWPVSEAEALARQGGFGTRVEHGLITFNPERARAAPRRQLKIGDRVGPELPSQLASQNVGPAEARQLTTGGPPPSDFFASPQTARASWHVIPRGWSPRQPSSSRIGDEALR